jgi:glycosyltransferase involved in cell wall biosynthesis
MYGVPRETLEFFPLGGFVYDDDTYRKLREKGRARLGLRPDQLLFLQTGKLDRRKKLIESLRAFQAVGMQDAVFAIAGAIGPDIAGEVAPLIHSQPNVRNLGWIGSDHLFELLCACDCYIQPGTQSATMQLALCARCPVLLDDVASHAPFIDGNGWLIRSNESLEAVFRQIGGDRPLLAKLSEQSLLIARRLLDYRTLAARLYR